MLLRVEVQAGNVKECGVTDSYQTEKAEIFRLAIIFITMMAHLRHLRNRNNERHMASCTTRRVSFTIAIIRGRSLTSYSTRSKQDLLGSSSIRAIRQYHTTSHSAYFDTRRRASSFTFNHLPRSDALTYPSE